MSSGGSLGEGGVAGALVWELGDRLQFSAWHSLPGTPGARTYLFLPSWELPQLAHSFLCCLLVSGFYPQEPVTLKEAGRERAPVLNTYLGPVSGPGGWY